MLFYNRILIPSYFIMSESNNNTFLQYIFRYSIKKNEQDIRQLRAVITYQYILACIVIFLLAAIADTLLGVYWLSLLSLVTIGIFIFSLYLHYKGFYIWTTSIGIISINLLILVHDARYGIDAGVYFFYFPLFFSIFSTLTFRLRWWFYSHLLLTIIGWVLMETTNHSLLYKPTHSEETLHRIFLFCMFLSLASTVAFVYFIFAQIRNNAVRQEREKLKSVLDSNAQMIMLVNKEGKIEVFNRNFYTYYQTIYDEILEVGADYLAYAHSYNRPMLEVGFAKAFAGEVVQEDVQVMAGSQTVWMSLNFVPVFDKRGLVNSVAFSVLDISERKSYEKNLRETNEMLVKLNHELDNFIYRSSHDMRAPLTSVLGLVGLIQAEEDEIEREEYVGLIGRSVQKLDELLVNISQYAKNKKLEVKNQPIYFQELVNELIEGLKFARNAQDVDFQVYITQSVVFYGDEERLRSVLGNLLSNSIRYRSYYRNSFVKVYIHVTSETAHIEVNDNGTGIESEYQSRIFEMFFKASQHSVGSGLGLYIVREMITAMNGTIEMHSVFDQGTVFTIHIPNTYLS